LNHTETRNLFVDPYFLPLLDRIRPYLDHSLSFVILDNADSAADGGAAGPSYDALLAAATPERREIEIDECGVAELFYTSGSTGRPKGVPMTHRQLHLHALNVMASQYGGVTDSDVLLHQVPLFHVNGWGTPHTVTAKGGTHVMLRKFAPADVCRLVQQEKITALLGVPSMFNALLAHPDLENHDLSSLHKIIIGGAVNDDYSTEEPSGVIRAYDAVTGALIWNTSLSTARRSARARNAPLSITPRCSISAPSPCSSA